MAVCVQTAAYAVSVADWNGRPEQERASIISSYIDKATAAIAIKNPALAQTMRAWFTERPAGESVSEGVQKLGLEIGHIDDQEKQGIIDLSKFRSKA